MATRRAVRAIGLPTGGAGLFLRGGGHAEVIGPGMALLQSF
ncbi:hypothetical protein DB30_04560 [Enhygromyxa salina]|uniref:Uncharacterized protein n=1 Tax=Enhygromyxa salina TaxID=215803 RepID=A0A0C1ZYR8_9BACT|nr:hypothetical protein DB30_04560 [Enhygromyxa salina]